MTKEAMSSKFVELVVPGKDAKQTATYAVHSREALKQ